MAVSTVMLRCFVNPCSTHDIQVSELETLSMIVSLRLCIIWGVASQFLQEQHAQAHQTLRTYCMISPPTARFVLGTLRFLIDYSIAVASKRPDRGGGLHRTGCCAQGSSLSPQISCSAQLDSHLTSQILILPSGNATAAFAPPSINSTSSAGGPALTPLGFKRSLAPPSGSSISKQ